jgi:hypothetical protein
VNIDISAEDIIMTANSNGRAEKKGSAIIMLQISKKERNYISALAPAIVTTGRDFNTIRPAYGLL